MFQFNSNDVFSFDFGHIKTDGSCGLMIDLQDGRWFQVRVPATKRSLDNWTFALTVTDNEFNIDETKIQLASWID